MAKLLRLRSMRGEICIWICMWGMYKEKQNRHTETVKYGLKCTILLCGIKRDLSGLLVHKLHLVFVEKLLLFPFSFDNVFWGMRNKGWGGESYGNDGESEKWNKLKRWQIVRFKNFQMFSFQICKFFDINFFTIPK